MAMVRYLILRTMVFIGCLSLVWLLGLRNGEDQVLAVIIAALASLVISAVVLKPFRERASADIATRVDRRLEHKRGGAGSDEAAEDAEVEHSDVPGPAHPAPGTASASKADPDSDFR